MTDPQDLNISISNYKKFKIVFLGDQNVGKSCVISRYVYDSFDENSNATIGVDFVVKSVFYHENTYKIHFWDTAGQERFHSLIPSYIKDCQIAILVYDVSSRQTFDNLDKWITKIHEERGEDICLALLGNKIDIPTREVTTEEGFEKAKSIKALFSECSAKTGVGIQKAFEMVISSLVRQSESENGHSERKDAEGGIKIGQPATDSKKPKSRCC